MTESIELKHPITINGTEVSVLQLRRPKVRDMLTAEKGGGSDAEKEILMFANLCEITPDSIQCMDLADYGALQRTYKDFLS